MFSATHLACCLQFSVTHLSRVCGFQPHVYHMLFAVFSHTSITCCLRFSVTHVSRVVCGFQSHIYHILFAVFSHTSITYCLRFSVTHLSRILCRFQSHSYHVAYWDGSCGLIPTTITTTTTNTGHTVINYSGVLPATSQTGPDRRRVTDPVEECNLSEGLQYLSTS